MHINCITLEFESDIRLFAGDCVCYREIKNKEDTLRLQKDIDIKRLGSWARNATKTPLKPRLRISIFQLSPGNRLLKIEQSGAASSTKVPPNLKQRESVKLKGSIKKGKQEPRDHHQTQHSPNSLALFATDSLELKLAYTAINEHTNTHKRLIFRN